MADAARDIELVQEGNQFSYRPDGEVMAYVSYSDVGEDVIQVDHTVVNPELRGQGIAAKLVDRVVQYAREEHKTIIPVCSYAVAYFERHKDARDVLAEGYTR